jgi:hypothetical protein
MVDESEDGPSFVRQRRNVMVSCLVVLAIIVLHLQYKGIRVLDVTAGAPENFDIAWATLIWYFFWRLNQCDAPGRVLSWPQGYAHQYFQSAIPRKEQGEQFKPAALEAYENELSKGFRKMRFSPDIQTNPTVDELEVKENRFEGMINLSVQPGQPVVYILRYAIIINRPGHSWLYERPMSIEKNDAFYRKGWSYAYLQAALRKQFFSEYYLPFFLAFICILYCCYHHIVTQ